MTSFKLALFAIFAGLAAGPTLAQQTGGYPPGASAAEIEALEQAETARLNNAILERDAQIVAANEAEAARFAAAQAEHQAAIAAHNQAAARYEAEVAAAEAAQARYEAEMAAWNRQWGSRY